ncbi:MAG TPA: CvpA family protein [Edaphocola sp.]|nr:CvpA family protein [Edaphocola sp.]
MIIDWIFYILLALFLYRGYRRGVILALFSVAALLVGIVAATKLSGTIIVLLIDNHPQWARWMPLVIYVLVFIAVAWLVRLLARGIQRTLEAVAMGWVNRMVGALLYGILMCLLYSVFLWLLTKMNLLSPETITASKTYAVLEPLAPKVFECVGALLPFAKEGFEDLSHLFEQINQHLAGYVGAH